MNLQALFYDLFNYVWHLRVNQFATVTYSEFRGKVTQLIAEIKVKGKEVEQDRLNAALFALCAWIDELVQKSNWEGIGLWQDRLLQAEYFNTTAAGEEFFTRLNKISASDQDLFRIYYRCLVLDFKGVYHKAVDKVDLLKFKKYALEHITQDVTMAENPSELVGFPAAYQNDKNSITKQNVKNWNSWLWWLLPIPVLLVIYFFFYFVINNTVTNYLQLIK